MRRNALLVCAVAMSLLFASCSESTTPNTDVSFENKLILRATVNGTAIAPNAVTSSGTDNSGTITFTLGATSASALSTLQLDATVSGVGVYKLGGSSSSGTFHYGELILPASVTNYDTGADAVVTLTVDKIDKTAKRVKGHFSGKVRSSAGTEFEVKDGAFEATW